MHIKKLLVPLFILVLPVIALSQNTDSLVNKLDSLKAQTDTAGQKNLIEPELYNEKTKITLKVFGILLLDDLKQQALSPFRPTKKTLTRDALILGATVGIAFLDRPIQKGAVSFRDHNEWVKKPNKIITSLGGPFEVVPLAVIAASGFILKNEKLRVTTALATQSYITATVWSTLFKAVSGRTRPDNYDAITGKNSTRFHGPFYKIPNGQNSAFPSGHTTLAFAAATVYAKEYKNIPIVPVLSYGIASLISVSRIIENRHWATDLISGGLLGFACGTQVVNNYHRYARLKRQEGLLTKPVNKGKIAFNLQCSPFGVLQPGVVYTFRK
ncbi:MAG: phosphatase PAP2 family protein [Chitinophagaceae bacterium]|nr:MAG: phosphatase PAP2 family protein [Chitinophagaceae bacterium]